MKRFFSAAILIVALSAFLPDNQKYTPIAKNVSFGKGEQLDYKVNFLGFTVGKAVTKIDQKVHSIHSRPCYKVDAWGETSDWISWVTRVKDNWGGYLDTTDLTPHVGYRKIREGRYKKDELTVYDHNKNKAEVKVMNHDTGIYGTPEFYDIPKDGKDLVSGFMYLRVIDFAKVKKGDTVHISGFYEDTAYDLRIMHKGIENIHTKVGKIPCYKLVPIMPDNKLFDGENSITVWLSQDENKIPVKIQAKMFIGHTGLELTSFRGLKYQIKIVR
jgi:Protein of unknown function (DUF3108)